MLCLKSVIEASSGVHFSHFQHISHVRELTGCKRTDCFLTCTEKSVKVCKPFAVAIWPNVAPIWCMHKNTWIPIPNHEMEFASSRIDWSGNET
jgi:hypothetical protein